LLAATLLALAHSSVCGADASAAAEPPTQPPADAPPVVPKPEQPMHDIGSMDMSSMQGGRAPADARDPDYAEGQSMSMMPGMGDSMDDAARFGKLLFDQLEYVHSAHANGLAIDAQAYYGGDADKLWLKVDGERSGGHLGDTRTEALWAHATSAFWDTQLGLRHDFGDGPERSWAAFGVQGLAPYWFDIEATAYLGQSGRAAVRVEAEYQLMLTQKLIFTPDLELNAYGKSDPARHIGSGLSNVEFGLRLRYEVTRQFAPYIGIDWNRHIGDTSDLVRAAGKPAFDHQIVAGVRVWF
jgi:copper resistance protein B